MAVIDFSRPSASGRRVGGNVATILSNVQAVFTDWYANRQTHSELSKLSDHELADIGLIRGDIDRISGRMTY